MSLTSEQAEAVDKLSDNLSYVFAAPEPVSFDYLRAANTAPVKLKSAMWLRDRRVIREELLQNPVLLEHCADGHLPPPPVMPITFELRDSRGFTRTGQFPTVEGDIWLADRVIENQHWELHSLGRENLGAMVMSWRVWSFVPDLTTSLLLVHISGLTNEEKPHVYRMTTEVS